jgi:hypothetical protein
MDAYFEISGCCGLFARRVALPERERALAELRDELDEAAQALAHARGLLGELCGSEPDLPNDEHDDQDDLLARAAG